jgi:hypothetical protein
MILTVLALGGAVLGATTIAGLLMLYQIRETTDLANSAKAIYAADSGIEWSLFNWFCGPSGNGRICQSLPLFVNGAKLAVSCYDGSGNPLSPCDSTSNAASVTFKAKGTSGNSNRAFGLSF